MNKIGLVINTKKPQALEVAGQLLHWFEERHIQIIIPASKATLLGRPELGTQDNQLADQVDCLLILGGDGTLLNTARSVAENGVPLLGVNLGQLGFLTEIELSNLYTSLEQLLAGEYHIEERMMLEAEVVRDGLVIDRFQALNDIVLTKGAFSRMINLETYVGNQYVATYPADGLIISSPTGSTAYSLSAGGPIVSPEVEVMIVTPICPHTLYARPVVISPQEKVRVTLRSQHAEVMLTVDGQHGFKVEANDEIVVHKSSLTTKLVRLKGRSFYEILREKLREGGKADG